MSSRDGGLIEIATDPVIIFLVAWLGAVVIIGVGDAVSVSGPLASSERELAEGALSAIISPVGGVVALLAILIIILGGRGRGGR